MDSSEIRNQLFEEKSRIHDIFSQIAGSLSTTFFRDEPRVPGAMPVEQGDLKSSIVCGSLICNKNIKRSYIKD